MQMFDILSKSYIEIKVVRIKEKKEGDLNQSYDKSPYTERKISKTQTQKCHLKIRLHNDCWPT